MDSISMADLLALGGSPDARFVALHPDGTIYFCTTARAAEHDEDYWRDLGYTLKRVEHSQGR